MCVLQSVKPLAPHFSLFLPLVTLFCSCKINHTVKRKCLNLIRFLIKNRVMFCLTKILGGTGNPLEPNMIKFSLAVAINLEHGIHGH